MRLESFFLAVALSSVGCAFTPVYLGMSQEEFLNGKDWLLGYSGQVALDAAQGNDVVYYDRGGMFYYFENGQLAKIQRGRLAYPVQPVDVRYEEQ